MNQTTHRRSSKRPSSLLVFVGCLVIAASFSALMWPSSAKGQTGDDSETTSSSPSQTDISTTQDPVLGEIVEPPYQPKSKSQLKRALTSIQYKVTQAEGTEPAFRNKYWDNKEKGLYRCVVCGQSLFSSATKYKSGTGWPSYWAPIKKTHVDYKEDRHLFYTRTEVHCSRCEAHLGHVFDDGPKQTTGKRYCMNSAALAFIPEDEIKRTDSSDAKTASSKP